MLRCCRTGSTIVFLAIGLAGCFHSSRALRQERRVSYWEALAELHPEEAIASARTPSEKEFAEALGNLMSGDLETAEQRFGKLRGTATDSIIRAGSRVIYTATLQYQEKWGALAVLKDEPSQPKGDRADKASIELWADAFKDIPPKVFTFRSASSRMPIGSTSPNRIVAARYTAQLIGSASNIDTSRTPSSVSPAIMVPGRITKATIGG